MVQISAATTNAHAPPQDAATATPVPRPATYRVVPDDGTAFSPNRVSTLHHNFHEHPMLQLPQLAELAQELMLDSKCRFLAPGATVASEFTHSPRSPLKRDLDEVFRRIEEPGSWIALYNIETVPRYLALLDEIISTVQPFVEREQRNIVKKTGFIFISAPPSVTPFHIDRENNFWLQLKGHKTITTWDRNDRQTVAAADVDDFIVWRSLENVRLKDGAQARGRELDRGPGEGLYFPSTTPHMTVSSTDWVRPGDGVAISIGVNFYTNVTRRHALVHQVNWVMRRMGLVPTPPGRHVWLDMLKAPLGRLVIAAHKRRKGGYVTPPGID